MSSDDASKESESGMFDPDDLSWNFSDEEEVAAPEESSTVLPDPAQLFRQMEESSELRSLPNPAELFQQLELDQESGDGSEDELPDPQELFQALTGASFPDEEPETDDLPDPEELFHQMVERVAPSEDASTVVDEELPDPEELYRKLVGDASSSEEELPDSEALFRELTKAQSVAPQQESESLEDDLPDPGRLFEEMSQREELKDDLHIPLPVESSGASSLWNRLVSRFTTGRDEAEPVDDIRLPLPGDGPPSEHEFEAEDSLELNIPLPTSQPTRARTEPTAPTGFWGRIKSKFGVDKSSEVEFPSLPEPKKEPAAELPSLPDPRAMFEQMERAAQEESDDDDDLTPAFPSPEELFRQLEREAREEMAASGASLPALPDLDSFRAELEAEERSRLDPDLLGDLSGPERFAETVSDLTFASNIKAEKPLLSARNTEPEEPLPAMLTSPESTKKGPSGTVRVDPGSKAPKSAPVPKPVYKPSSSSGVAAIVHSKKKVEIDGTSFRKTWAGRSRSSFSRYTLTIFTRQLAAMLKAGVQLHSALAFCADSSPTMARVLDDVGEKIQRGFTMSAAFAEHPKSFDPVYIGLLRSGELSGRLPEVIERLATVLEREMELRKRVISALTYPAVLLLVSLLGTFGFIYFVLPMITPLFADLNVPLPLPTRILISIRTIMVPTAILGALVGFFGWLMRDRISGFLRERPRFQRRIDGFLYKIPVFGNVYQKLVASRVLYSLATMLDVGVTMNQALARAESAAGTALMKYRLAKAREDLADGNPVTDCFSANRVFSGTALHLISAGEESAQLTEMFTYVAGYYDEEVEYSMDSAAGLLEPIIMVVMGLVVGFITVSAALPTITLLQNFT